MSVGTREPEGLMSDPEQLLTVADIAAHIGAHESTVRAWIKQGELAAMEFGARIGYRVKRADYEEFLRRRALRCAVSRQLVRASWGEPVS